jgi:hypothetical protein
LTAFAGDIWIGTGDEAEIRAAVLALGDGAQNVLLFDDATGRQVDIDLRAGAEASGDTPRGRGRPKLGVQSREVTLLPRHWDWLATQPGGASAILRKLVEAARKAEADSPTPRAAMDAAYHFMTAMAGDRADYETALRALYARDAAGFAAATEAWASGVRDHARGLAGPAFG